MQVSRRALWPRHQNGPGSQPTVLWLVCLKNAPVLPGLRFPEIKFVTVVTLCFASQLCQGKEVIAVYDGGAELRFREHAEHVGGLLVLYCCVVARACGEGARA